MRIRELRGRGILKGCRDRVIWGREVRDKMGKGGIMLGNISEFFIICVWGEDGPSLQGKGGLGGRGWGDLKP